MNKQFSILAVVLMLLLLANETYAQDAWTMSAESCGYDLKDWGSLDNNARCCVVDGVALISSNEAWKTRDECEGNTCEGNEMCCRFDGMSTGLCYGATRKLDTNGPLSTDAPAPGMSLPVDATNSAATSTTTTTTAPASSGTSTTVSLFVAGVCGAFAALF